MPETAPEKESDVSPQSSRRLHLLAIGIIIGTAIGAFRYLAGG